MPVPARQSFAHRHLHHAPEARSPQAFPAAGRAGAALSVQPGLRRLRQDPAARRAAAPADAGRGRDRGDRGERRPDGLDRRRRAADPPRHPRDRLRVDQAAQVRLPLHQRAADGEEDGPVQALAVLRLGGAHRRPARTPRRVGLPRRRVRQGGRRDRRGQAARLPRDDQHDLLHATTRPTRSAACSTSSTTSWRSTR